MAKRLCMFAILAVGLVLPGACGGGEKADAPGTASNSKRSERPAAPGGTILFNRFLDPEQQRGVLLTIKPDGSGERQITDPAPASDQEPGWSPDGGAIAFTRNVDGRGQVWTARADGSGARRLDPADIDGRHLADEGSDDERSDPAYSPDGSRIAFGRGWGKVDVARDQIQFADLYVMDTHGRHVRRFTYFTKPFAGDVNRASWSPDGTRIAFTRATSATGRPPDAQAIYVVALDGGRARRITPWSLRADDPDWSPRGDRIVFRTVPPGDLAPGGELYTVRPDGSHLHRLTHSPDGTVMLSAQYSPDGNWIVFSKAVGANEPDLYVMRGDGSGIRRVTKSPLWDSRPTWGP
jgi:Tol biopolymer transport system component